VGKPSFIPIVAAPLSGRLTALAGALPHPEDALNRVLTEDPVNEAYLLCFIDIYDSLYHLSQ
jgi:hypothetical protein